MPSTCGAISTGSVRGRHILQSVDANEESASGIWRIRDADCCEVAGRRKASTLLHFILPFFFVIHFGDFLATTAKCGRLRQYSVNPTTKTCSERQPLPEVQ